MRMVRAIIIASLFLFPVGNGSFALAASAYSNEALIDGFNKTVFGSEYSTLFSQSYVRKFTIPVRIYVRTHIYSKSTSNSKIEVETFIRSLRRLIFGLQIRLVSHQREANFVIHIVNRANYARVVRTSVYKQQNAPVRGRCMVRSIFNRKGITRSDVVIVADEGKSLFQRCMTEETLQGLGPLNDDRSLTKSMFNDTSLYTSFRRFDRYILNMLYDPLLKVGKSRKAVQGVLPAVLKRVRKRIEGGK